MTTRLKDLKKRLMEAREFREEYARADDEFALIEALVRARTAANLTQTELAGALARPNPPSHGWRAAGYRRPWPPCAAMPRRPVRG